VWLLDTSQKAKHWTEAHGKSKLTSLAQDSSETKILTGASDGVVKVNFIKFRAFLAMKL
jgi:WD repeat-containing protein 49